MKVITVFVSILISTLTNTAFAGLPGEIIVEPIFARAAQLDKMDIDPKFQEIYLPMAVDAASIEVSEITNTVTLTLTMNSCPEGVMCFVGPTIQTIELPIISSTFDACNTQTIVAKKDQMPVDGDRKEIKIVDNSLSTCDDKRTFTDVTLDTAFYGRMEANLIETHSTFSGNGLVQSR